MRAFKHDGTLFPILLASLLCASMVPDRLLADDKDTSNSPVKSAPAKSDGAKIEAPAPLTERERWLLDRVELLENGVVELETKDSSPAAPAAAAASSQPGSLSPSTSTVTASAAGATPTPAAAGANSNVIPTEKILASVNPQATEKGKPDTAKAPKAEPFAFADFTWLNGNARTKESPMDTKFFTPEIPADVDYIYDFNHPKDNTIGGSNEVFMTHKIPVPPMHPLRAFFS